jgi:hypothetical protein
VYPHGRDGPRGLTAATRAAAAHSAVVLAHTRSVLVGAPLNTSAGSLSVTNPLGLRAEAKAERGDPYSIRLFLTSSRPHRASEPNQPTRSRCHPVRYSDETRGRRALARWALALATRESGLGSRSSSRRARRRRPQTKDGAAPARPCSVVPKPRSAHAVYITAGRALSTSAAHFGFGEQSVQQLLLFR